MNWGQEWADPDRKRAQRSGWTIWALMAGVCRGIGLAEWLDAQDGRVTSGWGSAPQQ